MRTYNYKCACGASLDVSFADSDWVSMHSAQMDKWNKLHAECIKKPYFYRLPVKRNDRRR
jgi:hypothetical protein